MQLPRQRAGAYVRAIVEREAQIVATAQTGTLWVPRTVSRPLISTFAAGRPRSHGSQAAQQDRSPWPFDSRT
jgi:hypothetical protein